MLEVPLEADKLMPRSLGADTEPRVVLDSAVNIKPLVQASSLSG